MDLISFTFDMIYKYYGEDKIPKKKKTSTFI